MLIIKKSTRYDLQNVYNLRHHLKIRRRHHSFTAKTTTFILEQPFIVHGKFELE